MAKYIINVTFCIENQYINEWKVWANNTFLPMMQTHYQAPRIMRVMAHMEEGVSNFSIQHEANEFHDLTIWKHQLQAQMERLLAERFGQHILSFTTFLEIIQ